VEIVVSLSAMSSFVRREEAAAMMFGEGESLGPDGPPSEKDLDRGSGDWDTRWPEDVVLVPLAESSSTMADS